MVVLLTGAAVCASAGQVFLKVGANGAVNVADFVNLRLIAGLLLYAVSTLLWILALTAAPLILVYPFTALTFVLVYAAGILILREHPTPTGIAGGAIVLVGLAVMVFGQRT